jgi:hypothetical protein
VLKAPPPLRVETPLPRPSAKHIWVPGFYAWQSDAYAWTPERGCCPRSPTPCGLRHASKNAAEAMSSSADSGGCDAALM